MRLKLKYLQKFDDRFGRPRVYLRKPGHKRIPLPAVGTRGFMEAYELALNDDPEPVGSGRIRAGTMRAVALTYLASHGFTSLDPTTQTKYRAMVEAIMTEHGDRKIADLRREHVQKMLDAKAATPTAANHWLHVLRMMMRLAVQERLIEHDPTIGVRRLRYVSQGHKTWSEEDITKFESHFPVGTMPRMALALMLYTGARISDAVKLGRHHVKGGLLTYTQHKNRNRKPVTLTIPVHPELAKIIAATPATIQGPFLASSLGKPFKSSASLGNWMRDRCREAGLSECSSHGLRKATARRLAEAGMSPHQIGSITGHTTLKEIQRYTAAADQKRLAVEAMRGMVAEHKA